MVRAETIIYLASKIYSTQWDNLTRQQQIDLLDKKNNPRELYNLIADKNYRELKRNKYISL